MNGKEYVKNVLKTENLDYNAIRERMDERTLRLLHAAMGLCTEAGEFLDAMKKWLIYGKELDPYNLVEELGDGNWYEGLAIDALETTFERVLQININKLKARYGEKFNEESALNRDLTKEAEALKFPTHYVHFGNCLSLIDKELPCTCHQPQGEKEEAGEGIKPKNPAGSILNQTVKEIVDVMKETKEKIK